MKARRDRLERALDTADPAVRLFLLYGPDQSGSRALAARLGEAMGASAERIDLDGATLKADPARLADEAASLSLFGDRRWIRVDGAGDESLAAVEALLWAERAGNPVVMVAGELRGESKLVKVAVAHDAALSFASYPPDARGGAALAVTLARSFGLTIEREVAAQLAADAANDQAVMTRELEKFALYLDADPERPRALTHEVLGAVGAEYEEGDLSGLIDAALDGDPIATETELMRLAGSNGLDPIPLLRALQRRALTVAELRNKVDAGAALDAAVASLGRVVFWADREKIQRQARRWSAEEIQRLLGRVAALGRSTMSAQSTGSVAIEADLLAIARAVQRRR